MHPKEAVMNKMALMRPVNLALIISFVLQAITSLIIFFHIKVPRRWGIFDIHVYNGLLILLLALVHIWLNWGWIKANYLKTKK
jgi:heme/copper-type cytochrome/quinol oxidase subunit 4